MPDGALAGRRIVVTRARADAQSVRQDLIAIGALPLLFPVIRIEPLERVALQHAIEHVGNYRWLIFTSSRAVEFFLRAAGKDRLQADRPSIAAVGPVTAGVLQGRGIDVDWMPAHYTGAALAAGLDVRAGERILLPRASQGRPEIVDILRARGAVVDDIALYHTVPDRPTAAEFSALGSEVDALLFTSPSTVHGFHALFPEAGMLLCKATSACIGPTTAEAAMALGARHIVQPAEHTMPALLEALRSHFESMRHHVEH